MYNYLALKLLKYRYLDARMTW